MVRCWTSDVFYGWRYCYFCYIFASLYVSFKYTISSKTLNMVSFKWILFKYTINIRFQKTDFCLKIMYQLEDIRAKEMQKKDRRIVWRMMSCNIANDLYQNIGAWIKKTLYLTVCLVTIGKRWKKRKNDYILKLN